MSEPRGPCAIVSNAAEAGNKFGAAFDISAGHPRFAFMNDGCVKARSASACLIHYVARDSVTNEVGIPALAPIRSRLEARAGVRRAVDHDHRPSPAVFLLRDLKLHVHLADGDLLRCRSRRRRLTGRWRRWYHRVLRDLLHTTDEEAALIFDDERSAQKLLRLLVRLRRDTGDHGQQQHGDATRSSHRGSLRLVVSSWWMVA